MTTPLVIAEVCNFLSEPKYRVSVCKLVEALRSTVQTELIYSDQSLWRQSFSLCSSRSDKSWSLTDCLSFIVMQGHELTEALAADRHFEPAGFTILLTEMDY